MPTSPVKTKIPVTSFGHLVTEVSKQLFGLKAPSPTNLTGWRKHFNSYTLYGRRNCVLATYGMFAFTAVAYLVHRLNRKETEQESSSSSD